MTQIKIIISGTNQLDQKLRAHRQRLENLQPALRQAGEYLILEIDRRFEEEVDPLGRPWKPLAPATIAKKRAEGKIQKILQRTGFMRSQTFYQIRGNSLVVTNSDPKLRRHQLGLGVPKREVFGFKPRQY